MADPSLLQSLDFSIVDQTMCRHYIRIAICFSFPDPANTDAAIVQVKSGLRATLERWPYLAGELSLVPHEGPHGHVRHRAPVSPPDLETSGIFSVRMHTGSDGSMPFSYEEMAAAGMPCSMLLTQLICSFPDAPPLAANPAVWHPVLHVAMNFVAGGLILAVYGAHSVMDGVGLGHFVDFFAQNVRSTPLKKQSEPAFDRLTITTEAHNAYREFGITNCPEMRIKTEESLPECAVQASRPPPEIVGRLFSFPAAKLYQLRQKLEAHLLTLTTETEKPEWLSTWDTLAALMWVYQIRARFGKSNESNGTNGTNGINGTNGHDLHAVPNGSCPEQRLSRFGYTINVRQRMRPQLAENYLGNAVLYTVTDLPISSLIAEDPAPAAGRESNGINGINGINGKSSLIREGVPIHALTLAAMAIRRSNTDFDTEAVSKRLAYMTQIPTEYLSCLVPNMDIARPNLKIKAHNFTLESTTNTAMAGAHDGPNGIIINDITNDTRNDSVTDALTANTNGTKSTVCNGTLYDSDDHTTHTHPSTSSTPSTHSTPSTTMVPLPQPSRPNIPPLDIFATSWEDLGANADFSIAGTNPLDGRPDYVRKPKSVFNEGGTIIFPRRREWVAPGATTATVGRRSNNGAIGGAAGAYATGLPTLTSNGAGTGRNGVGGGGVGVGVAAEKTDDEEAPYEVLLQLPREHMERLCRREELGGWAQRIIE